MTSDGRSLAARLIDEIIAIDQGLCQITDESIVAEPDPAVAEVLAALLTLNEDIRAQVGAREQAMQSESALREMLDQMLASIDDAVFSVPFVPGGTTYMSQSIEKLYGRPRSAFLMNPNLWLECVHPDDRPCIEKDLATMPERGGWDDEHRVVQGSGKVVWVHSRGRLLRDASGVPTRIVGITTDISARKQLEIETILAHQRAEEARVAAEQARDVLASAARAREDLVAFLVHDINNQLSTVMGNAFFLAEDAGLQGENLEAAQMMHDATATMRTMVANLLDLSRAEDGQLVPVMGDVRLDIIFDKLRQLYRSRADDLLVRVEPKGVVVRTDGELIRRIAENLIGNALKHTPPGRAVNVDVKAQDGVLSLAVCDQGPGIPVEHRERIFEKYVRLENQSEVVKRRSRGLGLAFCRVAAQALGGRVWAEDAVPKGAAFHVELPLTISS